jgi:hypothetical protein
LILKALVPDSNEQQSFLAMTATTNATINYSRYPWLQSRAQLESALDGLKNHPDPAVRGLLVKYKRMFQPKGKGYWQVASLFQNTVLYHRRVNAYPQPVNEDAQPANEKTYPVKWDAGGRKSQFLRVFTSISQHAVHVLIQNWFL